MKKIAINGVYLTNHYKGSGFHSYLKNLLEALSKTNTENKYIVFIPLFEKENTPKKTNAHFHKTLDIPTFYQIIPLYHKKSLSSFSKTMTLNHSFKKFNFDFLFLPHVEFLPKKLPKTKIITVIHDVIPTLFLKPSFLLKGKTPFSMMTLLGIRDFFNLKKINRLSEKIMTISQTTKKNIIDICPSINKKKIIVSYNGISKQFKPYSKKQCEPYLKSFKINYKHYLLYFGGHTARKNTNRLYQAYLKLPKIIQKQYPLIVLGKEEKKTNHIYFLNKQDETTLSMLLAGALISVYPSLYEGFGLPVIESLWAKTYPIVSDIPTNRELLGLSWDFFDPYSINALRKKLLEKIETLEKKPFEISNKNLLKKIKSFSWEKTAKQLEIIFKK